MEIVDGKTKKTLVRKGRIHGMMIEKFGELSEGDKLLKIVNEETKENILITFPPNFGIQQNSNFYGKYFCIYRSKSN